MKEIKKPALMILHDFLVNHGYGIEEADVLISKLLEEEAEPYLEFIKGKKKKIVKKIAKKKIVKKIVKRKPAKKKSPKKTIKKVTKRIVH